MKVLRDNLTTMLEQEKRKVADTRWEQEDLMIPHGTCLRFPEVSRQLVRVTGWRESLSCH